MTPAKTTLSDRWIGRWAHPNPAARAAVAQLEPAAAVTGGSRGLGFALAGRFARAGHHIVLIARGREGLSAATAELEKTYPNVKIAALALDITDPTAPEQILEFCRLNGLYVDVLINNAGAGLAGLFHTHKSADVEQVLALNIRALTRLTHSMLPAMQARARGGIINIASLGGYVPGPYQAIYYASKSYVISLTEAVAAELAGSGVRLLAVAPGPLPTTFHATIGAQGSRYLALLPKRSTETVANSAYRAYRLGRHACTPGLLYTAAAMCLRVLPHTVLVPIMSFLLRPAHNTSPIRLLHQ